MRIVKQVECLPECPTGPPGERPRQYPDNHRNNDECHVLTAIPNRPVAAHYPRSRSRRADSTRVSSQERNTLSGIISTNSGSAATVNGSGW